MNYLLSHSDYVTVQTQDPDGNQFTVRHDGTHDVTLSQQYQEKMKNTDSLHVYSKVSHWGQVYPLLRSPINKLKFS